MRLDTRVKMKTMLGEKGGGGAEGFILLQWRRLGFWLGLGGWDGICCSRKRLRYCLTFSHVRSKTSGSGSETRVGDDMDEIKH
jgi:hypothetical protein